MGYVSDYGGRRDPSGTGSGVPAVLGLGFVHAGVAFALAPIGLLMYTYSRFDLSSWDQLARVEPSAWNAFLAAWGPLLLATMIALVMSLEKELPIRRIWPVQVSGMIASVVCTAVTYLTFSVEPIVGG